MCISHKDVSDQFLTSSCNFLVIFYALQLECLMVSVVEECLMVSGVEECLMVSGVEECVMVSWGAMGQPGAPCEGVCGQH